MSKALAIALEQEAQLAFDAYHQIDSQTALESIIDESHQAQALADSLTDLSVVLESITTLSPTDAALVQVIGDISGAMTGLKGEVFTPALEDGAVMSFKDSAEETSEKSASIMDKVVEAFHFLMEKIKKFLTWLRKKFSDVYGSLKESLADLKKWANKPVSQRRAEALRKQLAGMREFSSAVESFIPLIAEMAQARMDVAKTKGIEQEGDRLEVNVLNSMERVVRMLTEFGKKFSEATFYGGVHFEVKVTKIDRNEAIDGITSFADNRISCSRNFVASTTEEGEESEGTSKVQEGLIGEVEEVAKLYLRFLDKHGTLSLPTLGENVEEELDNFKRSLTVDRMKKAYGWSFGGRHLTRMEIRILNITVTSLTRDVTVITKVCGIVEGYSSKLARQIKAIGQVDEEKREEATA